jgi:DNA-directed RNA polymerase specialized sigma24 family protein
MEYSNSKMQALIDEWIHSERDRAVLKKRLIDGYTFERISELFDLSVRQTKNIIYGAEQVLFRHL